MKHEIIKKENLKHFNSRYGLNIQRIDGFFIGKKYLKIKSDKMLLTFENWNTSLNNVNKLDAIELRLLKHHEVSLKNITNLNDSRSKAIKRNLRLLIQNREI